MSSNTTLVELIVSGLGWPEGPAVLADGSLVFVESYCSQLTVIGPERKARQFAYVTGAPNSCVHVTLNMSGPPAPWGSTIERSCIATCCRTPWSRH